MKESEPLSSLIISKEETATEITEIIESPEPTEEEQWYLYGI